MFAILKSTSIVAYLASAIILSGSSAGQGLNCRGSSECELSTTGDDASLLNASIQNLADDSSFEAGQLIACTADRICAFLQNTGSLSGAAIKTLSPFLIDHGCQACGSVPSQFPNGDDNLANGELSFDFIESPCTTNASGLCSIDVGVLPFV